MKIRLHHRSCSLMEYIASDNREIKKLSLWIVSIDVRDYLADFKFELSILEAIKLTC